MKLEDIKKIYFIGIGGIGMSALARYFNSRQVEVFGYDKTETKLTKKLVGEGMEIHFEDDVSQIPEEVDLVVFTPAIPNSHDELNYFLENNFLVKKRSEVLGIISRSKKTIGVAGTHGKTSTSSVLTWMLKVGGIDCTAFLGGIAQNFESNFIEGKSDWVVIEADEYDRSFLHLNPDISIILSTDADHLDIYGDVATMQKTFFDYADKTKSNGFVFIKDGLRIPFTKNGITYGQFGINTGSYRSENVRVENGFFVFDFKSCIENIDNIEITLAGKHNVENATAAIAVAQQLGIKGDDIKKSLATFKGIKRRFERVFEEGNVVYIDDYAHHPSELKVAIEAAKMLFPNSRITGIFQPHLFSRTNDFVDGFATELDELDEVILMDIYPARELPMKGVTSEIIFDKMKNSEKVMVTKSTLMEELKGRDIEVLLTLGAGDVDTFVLKIKNWLSEK
ncbi:UDP-N-acetylmuramate--L-alanine ligase [Saprospiraceae bacterium]|nr:UDP-N-acetylmuramate--L-alanine ligase [Saprospiraceae bacterium]MDB4505551.1 UDP-N-acetylmuramate--L-alanine ligase [Saprospiraceae bacterium]MDC3219627.1 UDP-N-acetylmuramate--L-alanine ligase [Saprospiraceae bacterium]